MKVILTTFEVVRSDVETPFFTTSGESSILTSIFAKYNDYFSQNTIISDDGLTSTASRYWTDASKYVECIKEITMLTDFHNQDQYYTDNNIKTIFTIETKEV